MSKIALCVGINDYPGANADLAGCVNDAQDWASVLRDRGYTVHLLLDSAATRDAVLARLRMLVGAARYGDRVVFTYSGHGSWVADTDADEPDGRDEVLVLYDYDTVTPQQPLGGVLLDDEIQAVTALRRYGVRFTILSDSCFSGSVARFVSAATPAGRSKARYMPPAAFLPDRPLATAQRAADLPARRALSRSGAVLLAASSDLEFAYDASFGGRPNGAFTRAALDTLPDARSTKDWHARIRTLLPSQAHPQTPQLTATLAQRRWVPFG